MNDISDEKIKAIISNAVFGANRIQTIELKQISSNSLSQNYLCICGDSQELFIKIYYSEISTFKMLQLLYANSVSMPKPICELIIENNIFCSVYEYIHAISATAHLKQASVKTLASDISAELKKMHKLTVSYEVMDIQLEVQRLITYIQNHSVCFPRKPEIIDYLVSNTVDVTKERIGFAHMDFHLNNVMICKDNCNIVITDFENLAYCDTWRDFVYAAIFHNPIENQFWYSFILSYFDNTIPQHFWETVKYYCYVQVLRMIICEYKKKNYCEIERLSKSINDGFPICSTYPRWFISIRNHKNNLT